MIKMLRACAVMIVFCVAGNLFMPRISLPGEAQEIGLERANTVPYVPSVVPAGDGGVVPRGGTVGPQALRRNNALVPVFVREEPVPAPEAAEVDLDEVS